MNASGNVVGTLSRTAPQIGDTVVLNIDTGLQEAVQTDLATQILADRKTPDAEDDNKLPPAINGAAIVMNPQNGQVLAMASYPTYDLNEWVGGISSANFAASASERGGEQQRHPGSVHARFDLQADHRHGRSAGRGVQPVEVLRRHGDLQGGELHRRLRAPSPTTWATAAGSTTSPRP